MMAAKRIDEMISILFDLRKKEKTVTHHGLWIVFFSVGLKNEAEEKMLERSGQSSNPGDGVWIFTCSPHKSIEIPFPQCVKLCNR